MADDKKPTPLVPLAPSPWDYRAQAVGEIATWQPPLTSADNDIRPGFTLNKARARDLMLSDPYAANSVEVIRDAVIGKSFTLALVPDYEFLGVDADASDAWASEVEREWSRYAEGITFDADASRKCSFTLLMHQAQIGMHVDGEVLGIVRAKEGAAGYLTCLQLIEPERLDGNNQQQLGVTRKVGDNEVRFGVERDEYGEPIAYHICDAHPADARWSRPGARDQVRRVERYASDHRPQVLHVFDETRPSMSRGVSMAFLSTLKKMKMLSTFSDAELSRQIQAASWAAVIETELDYEKAMGLLGNVDGPAYGNNITETTMRHLEAVAPYYNRLGLRYNGSKVLHLVPGEQLKIVQGQIQGTQLEMFEKAALRHLAAGLNVSYEELSRDFSNVSYASARQSLKSIWRRYLRMRSMLVQKLAMPFFSAWLEEAIKTKRVPMLGKAKPDAAGWVASRHALCRGTFVSWGEPIIDPVKEYTGAGMAMAYGISTLRDEVASEGGDWIDTLRQREREMKFRAKLGLNPTGVDPTLVVGGSAKSQEKTGNPQEGRKARKDGPG